MTPNVSKHTFILSLLLVLSSTAAPAFALSSSDATTTTTKSTANSAAAEVAESGMVSFDRGLTAAQAAYVYQSRETFHEWLDMSQEDMRTLDGSGTPASLNFGWATPWMELDMDMGPGANARLAACAVHHFHEFQMHYNRTATATDLEQDPHGMDAFFNHQMHSGYRFIATSPCALDLRLLMHRLKLSVLSYLAAVVPDTVQRPRSVAALNDFSMWTSVHGPGSVHSLHDHGTSAVSGVYYASVPEGSGEFVLHDPRGPRSPFHKTTLVAPKEGKVLLFPSTMLHEVKRSEFEAGQWRVSFSFNVGTSTSILSSQGHSEDVVL